MNNTTAMLIVMGVNEGIMAAYKAAKKQGLKVCSFTPNANGVWDHWQDDLHPVRLQDITEPLKYLKGRKASVKEDRIEYCISKCTTSQWYIDKYDTLRKRVLPKVVTVSKHTAATFDCSKGKSPFGQSPILKPNQCIHYGSLWGVCSETDRWYILEFATVEQRQIFEMSSNW